MKKEIIAFTLLTLIGCNNGIKPKEQGVLQEQKNAKPHIEVLNNDSAYLQEVKLITTSKEKSFEEKQMDILLNIVSHLMKHNETEIKNEDGEFCDNISTYMCVNQKEEDFDNKKIFELWWSNTSIFGEPFIPTKITSKNDRFVLMFLENEKPLSMEEIPDFLHYENCRRNTKEEYMIKTGERFWTVLMCKTTFKHIVVTYPPTYDEEIKEYFSDFSCDCE